MSIIRNYSKLHPNSIIALKNQPLSHLDSLQSDQENSTKSLTSLINVSNLIGSVPSLSSNRCYETDKPSYIDPGFQSDSAAFEHHENAQLLKEKERQIIQLQEELDKLQRNECNHEYNALCNEITTLKQTLKSKNLECEDYQKQVQQLKNSAKKSQSTSSAMNDHMSSATPAGATPAGEDMNSMRHKLTKLQKDYQIGCGLITQLQCDLTNKDCTVSRMAREIEALKRDIGEKDVTIAAVQAKALRIKGGSRNNDEIAQRDREIVSLRQKLNQTEIKLQEIVEQMSKIKKASDQTQKQQNSMSDQVNQLRSQLTEKQNELETVKHRENLLKIANEKDSSKLNSLLSSLQELCSRVKWTDFVSNQSSAKDDDANYLQMMSKIRKVFDQHTKSQSEMSHLQKEIEKRDKIVREFDKSIRQINHNLDQHLQHRLTSAPSGRSKSILKDVVEISKHSKVGLTHSTELDTLQITILQNFLNELNWHQALEEALINLGAANFSDGIDAVSKLSKKMENQTEQINSNYATLKRVNDQHELEKKKLKDQFSNDLKIKLSEATNRVKTEESEKFQETLDNLKVIHSEEIGVMETSINEKLEEAYVSNDGLKKLLNEKNEELKEKINELFKMQNSVKMAEEELFSIKLQLEQNHANQKQITQQWEEQKTDLQNNFLAELEVLQDKIKNQQSGSSSNQDRLTKQSKQIKDLTNQISKLKAELKEAKSNENGKLKKAAENHKLNETITQQQNTISNLEKLISALKRENEQIKLDSDQNSQKISKLTQKLADSENRPECNDQSQRSLQDENSIVKANELKHAKMKVQKLEKDLNVSLSKINSLTEQLESTKKTLMEKNQEKIKIEAQYVNSKNHVIDLKNQLSNIENELKNAKKEISEMNASHEEAGRIQLENAALGAKCRGEQHDLMIGRQKEALTELRNRVRELEDLQQSASSEHTNLNALKLQLTAAKRELSELRASISLNDPETAVNKMLQSREDSRSKKLQSGKSKFNSEVDDDDDQEIIFEKKVGDLDDKVIRECEERMKKRFELDIDVHRSARKEAERVLNISENTYFDLLSHVSESLQVDYASVNLCLADISPESVHLQKQKRFSMTQNIIQKISILLDKNTRKNELLENYEVDLVKMRQAEALADIRKDQMDDIFNEMQTKSEENNLLRESLGNTNKQLNVEKQINKAIKQKKAFTLDPTLYTNEYRTQQANSSRSNHSGLSSARKSPSPNRFSAHDQCVPRDLTGKADRKKNNDEEMKKRREYEILALKRELVQKNQTLHKLNNRMTNLETTIGMKYHDLHLEDV